MEKENFKKFEKSLLALQVAVNECQEQEIYRIIKELVPELRQARLVKAHSKAIALETAQAETLV